jgi:hypothetical protein
MSCEALIEEFTAWLDGPSVTPTGTIGVVQFTLTSNQRNDQTPTLPTASDQWSALHDGRNVVAFGSGYMRGVTPFIRGRPTYALPPEGQPQLEGLGEMWFSDRYNDRGDRFGFDARGSERADGIRLTISWPGRATLVARSWGDATMSFDLQCVNDVMYGFAPSVGNQSRPALYTITLAPLFVPATLADELTRALS